MICAWFLIHTVLVLHYAHLYYGDVTAGGKTVDRGGLDFLETKEPDYWDFFYYAFVIGMTCQVSEVAAVPGGMRCLTMLLRWVAFFLNTPARKRDVWGNSVSDRVAFGVDSSSKKQ